MTKLKIVVEKHSDGFVAYPLGIDGVVVGEGDNHEEAVEDLKSALIFHAETFGTEFLRSNSPLLEAVLEETAIEV